MKTLYIAILYHQHQPLYKDPVENYYYLPWVRLHAIKDYYDMLIWVEKYPELKLNFNFVPSLMIQLEDYAENAIDKHLELTLKPVSELTQEDKIYILKTFFNCNYATMVAPYKRYKELFEMRGGRVNDEELYRKIKYFNKQDWLDLQVWSNLVWFDPYWRKTDNEIKTLFNKERNFNEEDKHVMVKKQRWICGQILKKLKQLQDENKIEVSFSAFYHPILPLLCDPTKAKVSNSKIVLPKNAVPLTEDAEQQIVLGKQCYEEKLGCPVKGFWPSEGSVSDDIIPLLSKHGIKWFATDEEILKKSIYLQKKVYPPHEVIYKHYQVKTTNNQSIYVIFRDREISDNIGFVYYRWNYIDAVKDMENKLKYIYDKVYINNNNDVALVSIILDGENCWENYINDGEDFLNELYKMLTSNKLFKTVRISDFIDSYPTTESLTTLWPGSWINANYNIWIGHVEDNTAWEYLYKTRDFLKNYIITHPEIDPNIKNSCWQEIYIAEGSDWYWWFGEEHYTAQSDIFDYLFRKHLKNIYLLLNQSPPDYLDVPIKLSFKKVEFQLPSDFISPTIDGKLSSYFEWSQAGKWVPMYSSMHHTKTVISSLYFGFDLENLYIRLDYNKENVEENLYVYIYIKTSKTEDNVYRIEFQLVQNNEKYNVISQNVTTQYCGNLKIDKIVELKIPFSLLNTVPKQQIDFFITIVKVIHDKHYELERVPYEGCIEIFHPDKSYIKQYWTV